MQRLFRLIQEISDRFTRSDMLQLATLFMAVLMVAFVISWPTSNRVANDSWYAVIQARMVALSLLALGYGASQRKPADSAALGCLLVLAVLSLPVEILGYLVSFPSSNLGYSAALMMVNTVAMFGMGYLLGALLHTLRLSFLTPLAVPALLVGLVVLDLRLGVTVFNPLAALTSASLWHLAVMMGIAIVTLIGLSVQRTQLALRQEVVA
jgi:hypothetical protein